MVIPIAHSVYAVGPAYGWKICRGSLYTSGRDDLINSQLAKRLVCQTRYTGIRVSRLILYIINIMCASFKVCDLMHLTPVQRSAWLAAVGAPGNLY